MTTFTPLMYRYLGLMHLLEIQQEIPAFSPEEEKEIQKMADDLAEKLSPNEVYAAKKRLGTIHTDFYDSIREEVEHELGLDDYRGYEYDNIDYDEAVHTLWTQAVRKRITVHMTYDSTTSGLSERYVDPYETRVPYGKGYCHSRGEVRKFRFDRVKELKLTDKTFTKK